MNELIVFLATQQDKLLEQTLRHTALTFLSVAMAIVVGIPLGILAARKARVAPGVLNAVGVLQTIPSIALLGFMIPLLGIGVLPAIVALMLYALLPLVRNTYTGLQGVDPHVVEAARALGMTDNQILMKVELPLAAPVILAGIRTATVINVGVATLAAYIGAGGLGEFIFGGIALNNTGMILGGAIPAALLAIALDVLLGWVQRLVTQGVHGGSASRRLHNKTLKRALIIVGALILVAPTAYYAYNALAPSASTLRAGFTPEFMGRHDGYLGLKEVYGLDMQVSVISDAVMYKAAAENKLDVISGYTTDGRIASYDLVALVDDKHLFPPYEAAPIVRKQTLDAHPEMRDVLNMLTNAINDSAMIGLNYEVDYLKRTPEDVAKKFLTSIHLLGSNVRDSNAIRLRDARGRKAQGGSTGTVVLGSKIFTEQYILIHMYKMLIEEYTSLNVDLKTGLGGTQICFGALENGAIDMYPEYTGTGLLVMLKIEGAQLENLLRDSKQVYEYVKTEFDRRYSVEWLDPIGFNNAYALMMRREQAKELHIATVSDLVRHLKE